MKHKNAFTLIELLAVIVILAIILAIAIPSVTNIISSSKLNGFNASSDMLERAAKTYMSANNITVASGTTSYILYSDMKNAGYIGKVSDPTSNNECTHSGVYVTNNSGAYTYKGALACDNYMDINAYNLAINGDFSNGTTGWGIGGFTINSVNDYNGGLSSSIKYINNGSSTGALSKIISGSLSDKYYMAAWVYIEVPGNSSSIYISSANIAQTVGLGNVNGNISSVNKWQRISIIVSSYAGDAGIAFRMYSYNTVCTVYIDEINIFDLTAIYGAGNEPTKAQMDNIMSNMGK